MLCGGGASAFARPAAARASARLPSVPVGIVETTADASQQLATQAGARLTPGTASSGVEQIDVTNGQRFQTMAGFGAAMTDSSADVLMHDLSAAQRATLLRQLFTPHSGLGLDYLRIPIGANDFSTADYTEDDLPAGQTDPTLAHFNIAHDLVNLVPALRAALAVNPHITILASPWSAPAWMKTPPPINAACLVCRLDGLLGIRLTASLDGGSLQTADLPVYAEYLTRFVAAYKAQGIPIAALTLDNEPDDTQTSYPGMTLTAAQEAELAPLVAHDLAAAKLHTQILGFDSDWSDVSSYASALLGDPSVAPSIAGTAFHCYAGDPSAQLPIQSAYPTKGIYETECSGYNAFPAFGANLVNGTQTLVINGVRDYSKTVMLWNLALDQSFGPTNGGCSDCVPNVTVNSATGATTFNVESDVLGQVSKFASPGAVRIGSTDLGPGSIETVAFANPNGTDVLLALNAGSSIQRFAVVWSGRSFTYTIPAGAVQTFVWQAIVPVAARSAKVKPKRRARHARAGPRARALRHSR